MPRRIVLLVLLVAWLGAWGPGCAPQAAPREPARVLFLGDSLTSGFGLPSRELAFPALLARALAGQGLPIEAVNAGVPGDTVADGLRRLPALLQPPPDVVVVALGGNDALRDLPVQAARRDLLAIVRQCRAAGARVLLAGVELPAFVGAATARAYAPLWDEVADAEDLPLVPSLLEGALGVPGMMQDDVIHPTAAGQQRLARNVEPALREVLADLGP